MHKRKSGMEAHLHLIERETGTANGSQGKDPEAKKKKKSRDLAKVMVSLETSIDLGSENNENQ